MNTRISIITLVFICSSFLASNGDLSWHHYINFTPDQIRAETRRLIYFENKADRLLAAELLGQFPLYFSTEVYLPLIVHLISDDSQEVRILMLSLLGSVVDGGFPTESPEKQKEFLNQTLQLLKSFKEDQAVLAGKVDALIERIEARD